ncbi:carbohydrate ABC transporter permease [Sanguibacter antarcticus]|uniref:Raffinose/stachyose/melibiose transport system permease protein n=1 Tax=Sanguibacter antarcticus TaxID=372484 RepID=A0A2A9E2E9_9MICO|nr:sugar ABC transporter permease [Sanguibacter antarcticus]PFG33013.1 raffinose/stachyose/melibiose transport system permease protein [Sanguibacter antarcticus]
MTTTRTRGAGATSFGPSALLGIPAMAFFAVFAILPLGVALYLSFTQWSGLGSPEWVGLENWRTLLTDSSTAHSLMLTIQLMVLTWLVQTPISLLLGVFLAGRQRYREILAVVYFVPLLLSSASIAIAYRNLLDPNFGVFSGGGLGWLNQNWLGDPSLTFYVVAFIIAWQFVPFHTLLYQGGARQIPQTLYEAAAIDGAGRARQFRSITLPQLRYTIVTSSTLILVGALTYFDVIFILTQGGPGDATRILPLDMYLTGFVANKMGLASAIAVVLVVLGMVLSLTISKASGFSKMESQLDGEA